MKAQDKNNIVEITGEIKSGFKLNHEVFGESFYAFDVETKRLGDSPNSDIIPCLVSERLMDVTQDWVGSFIKFKGQFRSFNRQVDENNSDQKRLVLTVFITELEVVDEEQKYSNNIITLNGFVCKKPVYRKTPLGREITDVFLAVNRGYGKSDYIPCILWGRNAKFASTFKIGENIKIIGRIQSRNYLKKVNDIEETRTAYEVSVIKVEICEPFEDKE